MTAPTPEQMRALADREEREAENYAATGFYPAEDRYFELLEVAAALRAAADQLEAVWESAALIAERDCVGVTLADLSQFPAVQATGARIAFNIRAAAQQGDAL